MGIYICRECNDIAYQNLRKKLDRLIAKYETEIKDEIRLNQDLIKDIMKDLNTI